MLTLGVYINVLLCSTHLCTMHVLASVTVTCYSRCSSYTCTTIHTYTSNVLYMLYMCRFWGTKSTFWCDFCAAQGELNMRATPWEPITADTNFQGLGGGCFADEKSFQWQRTLEFDVSLIGILHMCAHSFVEDK
jgi:hypothetical protein